MLIVDQICWVLFFTEIHLDNFCVNLSQVLNCNLQHRDEALILSLANYERSKINRLESRCIVNLSTVDSSGEESGAPDCQIFSNLPNIM